MCPNLPPGTPVGRQDKNMLGTASPVLGWFLDEMK